MALTICRKIYFNAAHRLHNMQWDTEKNTEVFGVCNSPNYHGHNYELIVKLRGEIDPDTGYVMDLKKLDLILKKEVADHLDHKNLNLDVAAFEKTNPTVENIAVYIFDTLKDKLPSALSLSIVLYETPKNFVEYSG
jgi:6-pyruvoyltetrahydropterin/6-carboxytetrahydropterin synthase